MFWIRADGNARIGAGHLMRCMSIAEELARREGGGEVCFLCADSQSAEMARNYGLQSRVLGTDYQKMESELPLWRELMAEPSARQAAEAGRLFILVDSYYVTGEYLEALGRMGHVILMDDFGRERYPVDCVINYNAPASPEAYGELYAGQDTVRLIGSRYVPLRRQFRNIGARGSGMPEGGVDTCRPDEEPAGKAGACPADSVGAGRAGGCRLGEGAKAVLITTGGGDSENIAGKILNKIYARRLEFHMVMGQFHPHFQEMKELEKEYANIHIHHNVTNMAALMGLCDIAVTAGGSTIYELAAVGVPFICFSYAENQEALTEYVGREKIGGYAGAWHREPEMVLERLEKQFWELVADKEKRREYILKALTMTDGRGAERIADALFMRL